MSDDILIDYDGDGLAPPEGFTGVSWEMHYWPNRKLMFRGHFVNGLEHGRQTCWWDNGRLAQTGISCDEWPVQTSCVPDYHVAGRCKAFGN